MEFLTKNRAPDDLSLLGKICFDTLCQEVDYKQPSDDFCGIYFEGRSRSINFIEDFSVLQSFNLHSEYNYPLFVFSPSSNNFFDLDGKYAKSRVYHIKVPECGSHDEYSLFMVREIWKYIPSGFQKLLFFHPDGFLIKSGWEKFILDNNIDYAGSAWCHTPGISIFENGKWTESGFPKINRANGGFSYRNRVACELISDKYGNKKLKETGTDNLRFPPEDLFYSHFINGTKCGRVASLKECMEFSLDPITLNEYNNRKSFGFHYPKKNNQFQQIRDSLNSI